MSESPGVRQRQASLQALTNSLPQDEPVLAAGTASSSPLVVTTERILRWGHDRPVSIPFTHVARCECWMHAHRWSVRLIHEPIDPRRPPSDARQWWRWHDRRADRRETQQSWTETVLDFSRGHTRAAQAIRGQLANRGPACVQVSPPPPPRPNAWAIIGHIMFGPWQARRVRKYRGSSGALRLRHHSRLQRKTAALRATLRR